MAISQGREIGGEQSGLAASLLFAAGRRPSAGAIREFAEVHGGFAVSFDPLEQDGAAAAPADAADQNWLELLVSGLTYDLSGTAAGPAPERPPCVHAYAVPANAAGAGLEAVTLRPSPHLAGGHAMPPVIRSLALLAARLAEMEGVEAIAWHPARSWCGREYFRSGVLRWIDGGVFPGLGLTALARTPDGGMQSEGLSLFAGQDLRLEPELMSDTAEGAKIGVRLIDYLVETGPIEEPRRVSLGDGKALRLEPSPNGRFVRAWRG